MRDGANQLAQVVSGAKSCGKPYYTVWKSTQPADNALDGMERAEAHLRALGLLPAKD